VVIALTSLETLIFSFRHTIMNSTYINFMLRDRVDREMPTALEVVPNFYLHSAYYSFYFLILMASVPSAMKNWFPKWYNSLDTKKKSELPAYLTSMLHHLTVVPLAWYCIFNDFVADDPYNKPYDHGAFLRFAAPFCVAFVVADTFYYAIPLMSRGNFEYVLHHALALWMTYSLLSSSGHLIRYFPHIVICDTTNGVFNMAWILRLTGHRDSPLVALLEVSFAVLFFVLRIINLSVVFYIMFNSPDGNFGVGKYVFPCISMLQFYWLVKIVQALAKKFVPGKEAGMGKKLE
jgi:hypothetical protein